VGRINFKCQNPVLVIKLFSHWVIKNGLMTNDSMTVSREAKQFGICLPAIGRNFGI